MNRRHVSANGHIVLAGALSFALFDCGASDTTTSASSGAAASGSTSTTGVASGSSTVTSTTGTDVSASGDTGGATTGSDQSSTSGTDSNAASGDNGGPPPVMSDADAGSVADATMAPPPVVASDAGPYLAPYEAGTCTGAICNAQTWADITTNHVVPDWVKKTKLGIGMHFMVATVPADHNEWFYQHEYCDGFNKQIPSLGNFPATSPLGGGPFGYKDFIPYFTCAAWNSPAAAGAATSAASWAALFAATGATFVNATAMHHDRFAMWDSAEPASVGGAGIWNAAKMGPKRDVVGELATAVRATGLKFGVNNHMLYGYSFAYCGPNGQTNPSTPASVSDLYDPRYASLYGPPNAGCGVKAADGSCSPDKAFCDDWLYRAQELADKYQLDDEWFDWDGATVPNSPCMIDKLTFALNFYKHAAARGQQVQLMSKAGVFPNMNNSATGANVAMQDFQSSIPSGSAIPTSPWMADETISANGSWCYVTGITYKSATNLTNELASINKGGGVMLLNVSPEKDGTIPQPQVDLLNAVGTYMKAHP